MASRIVRVAGEALQLTGAMRTARRGLVDHAHAIRALALRLGRGGIQVRRVSVYRDRLFPYRAVHIRVCKDPFCLLY